METWAPIPEHPHYEASSLGRIRSMDRYVHVSFKNRRLTPRFLRGKVLQPGHSSSGYLIVILAGKSVLVHHAVASAFIGPRPQGKHVLHADGRRHHNAETNLRYGTRSENMKDAARHGTLIVGSASSAAKLYEGQVACILALRGYWSQAEAARIFRVAKTTIRAIHRRQTWKHVAPLSVQDALKWFYAKVDLSL